MRLQTVRTPRRGAHIIECAIVYPIVFFLILSTFIGGMGVFRYQQLANAAREATRFASTHGGQYAQENSAAIAAGTLPTVDKKYIINNIINPKIFLMDTSQITTTININTPGATSVQVYDWDKTDNYPDGNQGRQTHVATDISGTTYTVTNTVQVTVSYNWMPEWFLTGPINLTSTSVMPMSY
jgi:Flp pilus assembly protein TadG